MDSSATVDYLIVGQGLAGSILAWLLDQQQKSVVIVDRGSRNSASAIAAGLVNPIAGRRLVKHPQAEICLQRARALYSETGRIFQQSFYHERPLIRLFVSEDQQHIWNQRSADPAYSAYIGNPFPPKRVCTIAANQFGGGYQKNCGFLDTHRFLSELRKHFQAKNRLIESQFSWNRLRWDGSKPVWRNFDIATIISCDGFQATGNPYFSWLPFQLAKGEILTLESSRTLSENIVTKGRWVLPLDSKQLKSGATYQWKPLDREASAAARRDLMASALDLVAANSELTLLNHAAGIRSGTHDKNPFAGSHPTLPGLSIFNGFGSRGVLTIPYYAECFVQHLLHGAPLPDEIDIARFL